LLSQKSKIGPVFCSLIACVAAVFCWSNCYGMSSRESSVIKISSPSSIEPNIADAVLSIEARAEPCSVQAPAVSHVPSVVEQICSDISRGNFAGAQNRIEENKKSATPAVKELENIVLEYEAIDQKRRSQRESLYRQRLTELDKLRTEADVNGLNDVNDINKAFAVIAKASEYADEKQKKELMSIGFVKEVIEKSRVKAAEFESKGEWLNAYVDCYGWLERIDENNDAYTNYAEELLDKANIVASFQDSPCETSQERYEGVKKEMFSKAIDALNFNYVRIIDYSQMADKGINRCRQLADVMTRSYSQIQKSRDESSAKKDKGTVALFIPPDSNQLAAWFAGLNALSNEIKQSPVGISKDKFIDIFEKVLAINSTTTALPEKVLIAQFAEASLASLDPYTTIVWPQQTSEFEKMMTNEFSGVGIVLSKEKGLLTVGSLMPDTPAYNSGIDAEDVIEKVDGVPTKDMSISCAVKNITGPAGTKVTLTVRRPNEEETRDITITRAKITVATILGWQRNQSGQWVYMLDDVNKIGYVRITSFDERTSLGLEKVLQELEAQGMKGLVLDLRFNPGGLLNIAAEVVDKFIDEGGIVSTRPRFGAWTYLSAHKENTHPDYPLVILINRYSASASEIVSGALADPKHKRAVLVGERTYGKGSVQGVVYHPGEGAQLKYTMAYYHLPSGQRVEGQEAMKKQGRTDWGVDPNVAIKLRSDEAEKMSDVRRDNDVLVRAGHVNGSGALKKHTMEEVLESDSQLAIGLLVLKSEVIQKSERFE
jgi:carboxyl-terminal processing protease